MKECIYKTLIENSPIPYIGIRLIYGKGKEEPEIRVLDINKSFESTFEIDKAEIKKINIREKLSTNQRARLFSGLDEANRTGSSVIKYNKLIDNVYNIDVYSFEKDEYHLRITELDVKEANEISEKNFLDLTDNIDELIIIRDEKKALYISPYFEVVYNFKPDALYEDIENWYKHWDYIEFLEKPLEYDYKGIDISVFRVIKHGEIDKWIQSKFIPIYDDQGNISKKIGILRDITDKKRLEEEVENLRMEFFANVSHELRTPVNVIISALQMMKVKVEQFDQAIYEEFNKYGGIITQNGYRLIRLVNNLIDITKINSDKFEHRPINQDIVSCVEDICTSVVEFVERNNLEIIFDTDVEEKIISFDINQMERIILNLISNAIKFNQQNGRIEVVISTEDQVTISVKDSGIGIPKDKLESIFGRFEQAGKNLKREKEGSGIGLALVKSLVEMHGGTIKVVSTLGQGSEFIVTLPDVILPEQRENSYIREGYNMKVEFSDIYC